MGETAAGVGRRGWRSTGLMQRLADLQREGAPPAADCPLRPRPPTGTKLRPFAVGLLGSLAVGVAAFALITTRLKVEAGQPPSAPGAASAWPDRPQPVALDLPILKGGQPAAFPLLVTGLDGAGEVRIVLQHLPEAVWFSRGERRDEHTWELARADLDDLCVTLRPGTPPAFMVGIEVIGANAAILTQTSAAVRLIEAGASADVASPPLSVTANSLRRDHFVAPPEVAALTWSTPTVTREGVAREGRMRAAARAAERPLPAVPDVARQALSALPQAGQRPPGMSALGALSREPTGEGRWLWWRLPVLAGPRLGTGEGERR
jgi:hypothetical protein